MEKDKAIIDVDQQFVTWFNSTMQPMNHYDLLKMTYKAGYDAANNSTRKCPIVTEVFRDELKREE